MKAADGLTKLYFSVLEREEKTIELTFGVQPEFHKEKLITLNDIQKLCQENKRFFQEMQQWLLTKVQFTKNES